MASTTLAMVEGAGGGVPLKVEATELALNEAAVLSGSPCLIICVWLTRSSTVLVRVGCVTVWPCNLRKI